MSDSHENTEIGIHVWEFMYGALKLSHKPTWDRMVARPLWTDGLYSETLTFHTGRL